MESVVVEDWYRLERASGIDNGTDFFKTFFGSTFWTGIFCFD